GGLGKGNPAPDRAWGKGRARRTGRNVHSRDRRTGLAFSQDGKVLAYAGLGHIRLLQLASGKDLCPLPGHDAQISVMAFSPDSKLLATGSMDNLICIWDADTGRLLHRLPGHTSQVGKLIFSPDSKQLVSTSLYG